MKGIGAKNGGRAQIGRGVLWMACAMLVSLSLNKLRMPLLDCQSWRVNTTGPGPGKGVTMKDADGCYHIFLDGGANIGVHGRFLLEPERYPDARVAHSIFNNEFGPPEKRDNRDFCIFEMEANPAHYQKLVDKQNAYANLGWRYKAMNVGLSDGNGTMPFYRRRDEVSEEWGFSVRKFFDDAEQVDVPTLQLSRWIEEHVLSRQIPSKPFGEYDKDGPMIVVKLDIEGSEYIVLPDLISSGVFCQLDYVFGEFHNPNAPFTQYFPGLNVALKTQEQAVAFERAMMQVINSFSRVCKVRFRQQDDEAYLHDGVPLPTENQTQKNRLLRSHGI